MSFRWIATALVLIASAPGAGAASSLSAAKIAAYEAQLAAAESRWTSASLSAYAYQLREGGRGRYDTYRVRVTQGACTATMRTTLRGHSGPWRPTSCEGHRVEDQFLRLRDALQSGLRRVYVEYDAKLGFIAAVTVEAAAPSSAAFWYVETIQFSSGAAGGASRPNLTPLD